MEYRFKKFTKTPLIKNHLNLGGESPSGEKTEVTNLYFERGGKPWIAVMGEYHFSRDKRENWYRELCKMKAGGISVVSTYLLWIYHEELEGQFDFSGDLDIREFVLQCKKAGLDVVLRIGPWAHGECRNGGFPDWLLTKPYSLRNNNPGYMAKAKLWYEKISEQVQGLFYKDGGNIIAVQLENELVDSPEHLLALKKTAIEAGIIAPIYTVTGWNSAAGAKIPVDDVIPVFGGYADLPWETGTEPLPPSKNYYFNGMRNDSAIGTDLIENANKDSWQLPYEKYPFATCELGGGIQPTHHRRPHISPMDIYALSLVKLGSGNNLIGYYMYHGGTNRIGRLSTLNESKATGYPNDYPILNYDFQAPLTQYGEARGHYGLLNLLHLFVHSFEGILAPMEYTEPEASAALGNMTSLRYAMRTDGESGFVFINHYQRGYQLEDIHGAVINTGTVVFPPIDITGEKSFFMPFNIRMGDTVLEYATAQPLCIVDGVYFFVEIDGIKPTYQWKDKDKAPNIVTLSWETAKYARLLSNRLYIGKSCDLYEENGEIKAIGGGVFEYDFWNGSQFTTRKSGKEINRASLTSIECEEPFPPKYADELNIGGTRRRTWRKLSVDSSEGFIEIEYTGDAAQIYADGVLIADEYYYGETWRVPCNLIFGKECYLVVSEMKEDFYIDKYLIPKQQKSCFTRFPLS